MVKLHSKPLLLSILIFAAFGLMGRAQTQDSLSRQIEELKEQIDQVLEEQRKVRSDLEQIKQFFTSLQARVQPADPTRGKTTRVSDNPFRGSHANGILRRANRKQETGLLRRARICRSFMSPRGGGYRQSVPPATHERRSCRP